MSILQNFTNSGMGKCKNGWQRWALPSELLGKATKEIKNDGKRTKID